jgi:sulfate permease, SulP family
MPPAHFCVTASRVRPGWSGWGDMRGGFAAATMTLITAVSYAAVAGAPLGGELSSAVVLAGLIGSALGGAVAALWGSAPGQIFSLRASVAVVIASALSTQSAFSSGSELLIWLTACLLLAATLQWGFGAARLGGVIRLIPHSVTAGLAIGIAADMAWTQLPHWLPAHGASGWVQGIPLAVGVATVAALAFGHWRGWKGAALLLGVAGGVLAHMALSNAWPSGALPHLPVIDLQAAGLFASPLLSVAALASALNSGALPAQLPSLVGFALAIAFINSVETLTSTVVLEEAVHKRFDANKALIAGARGSIVAVCAGGWPVAGSAATSVVSVNAGARTRHAALIAAGVLVALSVVASRWLSLVPLAVVAGLMLTVAFSLGRKPLRELLNRHNTPSPSRSAVRARAAAVSADMAVAALVCALFLMGSIVSAVLGGVVAATLVLVVQMRRSLVRRRYSAGHAEALSHLTADFDATMGPRIQIVEVTQPLFFATADALIKTIEELPRATRYAIVDLTHVGAIDGTAARMLTRCGMALRRRGRRLVLVTNQLAPLCCAASDAQASCKVFASLPQALRFAARRYDRAQVSIDEEPSVAADGALAPCTGAAILSFGHPAAAIRSRIATPQLATAWHDATPTHADNNAWPADNSPARDRSSRMQRRLHVVRDSCRKANT